MLHFTSWVSLWTKYFTHRNVEACSSGRSSRSAGRKDGPDHHHHHQLGPYFLYHYQYDLFNYSHILFPPLHHYHQNNFIIISYVISTIFVFFTIAFSALSQSLKPHNEGNLHSSPNSIRTIKPRTMRWVGHVASMGRWEMRTRFWLQRLNGKYHSEDVGVSERIILKIIIGK
jgi:hypothetical protein